jgi:hypothetical protein
VARIRTYRAATSSSGLLKRAALAVTAHQEKGGNTPSVTPKQVSELTRGSKTLEHTLKKISV